MPVRVKPLSARTVDTMKPGMELADGALPGLRVRVSSTGERSWSLLVANRAGVKKRFMVGIGLSLAEARGEAGELRKRIREGFDPTAEKRAVRARAKYAREGNGTLRAVIEGYYKGGPGAALRTRKAQQQQIANVFCALLDKPAVEVTRVELQLKADGHGSASAAGAAVGALRPILKWAAKRHLVREDHWRDLERPDVHQKAEDEAGAGQAGQRHLSAQEIGTLWSKLTDAYGVASKFMLYTAVRRQECCGATWGEIDLDEGGVWTIAAARRKDTRSKRKVKAAPAQPHVIPLPRQAVDLLRQRLEECRKANGGNDPAPDALVFPGPEAGSLCNWPRWLRRVEKESKVARWSPHALRRTCSTLAAELGAEPHVVAAILGHAAIGGDLQSRYQRSRYTRQHAEALQLVADRIAAIVAGEDNVVALGRRA